MAWGAFLDTHGDSTESDLNENAAGLVFELWHNRFVQILLLAKSGIMGWRKTPFIAGRRYRVRKDFAIRFLSEQAFKAGEEFVYCSDCYSRYDGFSCFTFQELGTELLRCLEIADDHADPDWSELFEEIQSDERTVA